MRRTKVWLRSLKRRKRPLGRPWRRWEDNIKLEFRDIGCDGDDWINLAQDKNC
jgi:hypothetical protein